MPILSILLLIPALTGLALLSVPALRAQAKWIALGGSLAVLAVTVGLVVGFDKADAGAIQFAETHAWIPQIGASWALGVNGIGLSMLVLAAVLVPLTILSTWNSADAPGDQARYLGLVLVSQAFMIGIFSARDVFLFYVLFEAMLIPLYFLIGAFGGEQRRYAAVKFLLYSLVGGLVMLVAVVALYFQGPGGEQAFLIDSLVGVSYLPWVERLLFVGFFVAFAIKAPLVPVHTWLPTVAESARPGTTALLVAVLDKIGTFGMLTLCLVLFPEAAKWAAPFVIVVAVISVIYGAIAAIGQDNMLRLVAFTSVSHFGIMILGIFAFAQTSIEGAAFYMLNHGLSTGALFLLVGFLIERRGSASVKAFGGLQKVVPVFAGTFLIVGLSALALPGLSPFASEIMVLVGAFGTAKVAVIIAATGVVLAALYILLTYQKVFTGPTPEDLVATKELSLRERLVIWPLIAIMIVLGVVPSLAIDYVRAPSADIVAVVSEEAGK